MADIVGLYPFGTNDGYPIPLDAITPAGILKIDFVDGVASAAASIPDNVLAFTIAADQNCVVAFAASGAVATLPVSGTVLSDAMYVFSDIQSTVAPPANKRSVSVIGDGADGTAIIQFLGSWVSMTAKARIPIR